jgi:16S rRNA (cytosine1402-N4)-methyltransferase
MSKNENNESRNSKSAIPNSPYHTPVLLTEAIDSLKITPNGTYVDCTFGGGGHSKAILEKLGASGKLVAFDQDEDAKSNLPGDERLLFVQQNFRHLQRFLRLHNISVVDGILADLGVSSHQFDEPQRGFSTRFNASMDMRMDRRESKTAFDVISTYGQSDLHKLFEQYGEITNAKTLAKSIVQARETVALRTVDDFKNALRGIVKGNPKKYFARVFQALRIEVNDELGALKEMLQQVPHLLRPGGRVAIITFHSLEDRLVKNFFRYGTVEQPEENPFSVVEPVNELKIVTKKPITPGETEKNQNPRSASAKLRVAEKVMSDES